jgi:hypothetical protein
MSPQRRFPNEPASVSDARRFTLEAVGGVSPQLADAVAVMVSELAANAVRHTGSHFTLNIERSEALIRVAVTDAGSGSPIMRNPEPIEPTGRGLQIVQALAADWGVVPAPNPPGKTVWFTVDAAPATHEESESVHEVREPVERRGARAADGAMLESPRGGQETSANRARLSDRFGGRTWGYDALKTHRQRPARIPPRRVHGERRAQRKAFGIRAR